jgi:hypothetical protein
MASYTTIGLGTSHAGWDYRTLLSGPYCKWQLPSGLAITHSFVSDPAGWAGRPTPFSVVVKARLNPSYILCFC